MLSARLDAVDPGVVSTPLWEKAATAERALGDELADDSRLRYGALLARRQELLRMLGQNGASADAVADAVVDAILGRRPKRRYTVGLDAKVRIAVAGALPERLRFWLARRITR